MFPMLAGDALGFGPNFMQMLSMVGTLGNAAMGLFGGGQQQQHHHHHHHHHHHDSDGDGGGLAQNLERETERAQRDAAALEGGMGGFGGGMGGFGGDGGFGGFPGQGGFGGFPGQGGFGGYGNMWPGGQGEFGGFGSGWPQFGGMGDPDMGGMGGLGQQQQPWSVTNTGQSQDHIDLGNYTLDLNKSNMGWTLTNKETGKQTQISGDPHVKDGQGNWNFKNNLSFQLDDGTRITVHTIPYGNGATVSSELDITKGGQGMKVTGLGGNLDGPLQVTSGLNGYALDAQNLGTDLLYENAAGDDWLTMDGQVMNQNVAQAGNF